MSPLAPTVVAIAQAESIPYTGPNEDNNAASPIAPELGSSHLTLAPRDSKCTL